MKSYANCLLWLSTACFFPELGTSNTKVTLYFPLMVYNVIRVEEICLKFDMQNNLFGKNFWRGKKKNQPNELIIFQGNYGKKAFTVIKNKENKAEMQNIFQNVIPCSFILFGKWGRCVKISCTRHMLLVDISNILPQLKIYRSIGSSWKIKVLPKVQFPYFQQSRGFL